MSVKQFHVRHPLALLGNLLETVLPKPIVKNAFVAAGTAILCIVFLVAALAPVLAPYDPTEMHVRDRLAKPSMRYILGTDEFGRDLLSRMIYGTRYSLRVGLLTAFISGILGALAGLLCGYFDSLDRVAMRAMDGLMAFPEILLAIAIMSALGQTELNVVLAISIVYTPRVARVVRAVVLQVKQMEYIDAARATGASVLRILFRHILPNCLSPLIVQVTFIFAYAVLAEAGLSFVGVGVPAPAPTWGNIASDGCVYIRYAPWLTLVPGTMISLVVLALNLVGDGLRDALDPRLRKLL